MNKDQALRIMDLDASASEDQIKKRYRELTKKFHPDINKEPGAEDRFKEINAAYATLTNPTPEPQPQWHSTSGFGGIADIFESMFGQGAFSGRVHRQPRDVRIGLRISFEDAVKGCERDIGYTREEPCSACQGTCIDQSQSTSCAPCHGVGYSDLINGRNRVRRICPRCGGNGKSYPQCGSCRGTGVQHAQKSCRVRIPEGVNSGVVLRLAGKGNYVPFLGQAHYMDAFIDITVDSEPNMRLEGNNVVSEIDLSLRECLTGASVPVTTVWGDVELTVPPRTRHSDVLSVPNHGVRAHGGAHKFIVNTIYPDDLTEVISSLKNTEK